MIGNTGDGYEQRSNPYAILVTIMYLLNDFIQFQSCLYLLAVKPTHRAYGTTFRSQCDEAKRMIVVVIQIQPTNIQTSASSHSGCKSGVKHICGRL